MPFLKQYSSAFQRAINHHWLHIVFICVWLGGVICLGGLGGIARSISILHNGQTPVDFNTFYLAGRLAALHPASLYDDIAMTALAESEKANHSPYQVDTWAPPYAYPPFFAVLLRPIAVLPYAQSMGIWLGLAVICWLLSLPLLIAIGKLNSIKWTVFGLVLVLLFVPAAEAITLGQVGAILLFLTVASLYLLQKNHLVSDFWAGLLLGLATGIKIFPIVLLGYLFVRRRWSAVAGGAVSFLATLFIGIAGTGGLLSGWSLTWDYFTNRLFGAYAARFNYLHPGNQALTSLVTRVLGNTPPARMLGLSLVALVFCATWWLILRRSQPAKEDQAQIQTEFALVSLLPLLIPTGVYSHTYILALLPLAVLGGQLVSQNGQVSPWRFYALAVSFLLMIIACYAEWLYWPIFFAIPFGLVGILILWIMLLIDTRAASRGSEIAVFPARSLSR